MSVILGIDPGLATVGFGVVERKGGELLFVDCGVIKTSAEEDFPERLGVIADDIAHLLDLHKPAAVGVEELFFAKNVTNAIKVAHARGVILEAIHRRRIPFFEFTPLQVKNNIAGYGQAEKWQVQEMVKRALSLPSPPKPDDAADALAVAICAEMSFKKS